MDKYQGDLSDIILASGASYGSCSTGTSSSEAVAPFSSDPSANFGDPFSNMRDPLLHELNLPGSTYFSSSNSAEISSLGHLKKQLVLVVVVIVVFWHKIFLRVI